MCTTVFSLSGYSRFHNSQIWLRYQNETNKSNVGDFVSQLNESLTTINSTFEIENRTTLTLNCTFN